METVLYVFYEAISNKSVYSLVESCHNGRKSTNQLFWQIKGF